jgi:hypothetical protein
MLDSGLPGLLTVVDCFRDIIRDVADRKPSVTKPIALRLVLSCNRPTFVHFARNRMTPEGSRGAADAPATAAVPLVAAESPPARWVAARPPLSLSRYAPAEDPDFPIDEVRSALGGYAAFSGLYAAMSSPAASSRAAASFAALRAR